MTDNLHKPGAWVHVSPGGTEDIILSAPCQCGRSTCNWTFSSYVPSLVHVGEVPSEGTSDNVRASAVCYDSADPDDADEELTFDGLDEGGDPLPTDPNQVVVDMVAYKARTGR